MSSVHCEGTTGRIFEITKGGDLVWEYVNPYPEGFGEMLGPMAKPIYSAFRYSIDFPGIRKNVKKI